MNSNRGVDPMLSSLMGDSMWNTKIITEPVMSSIEQLASSQDRLVSPVPDVLLSPETHPHYSDLDLDFIWGNERKRVTSIKMEEDETFSSSPCSMGEIDSSEIDMEECDIKRDMNLSIVEDDGNNSDSNISLPHSRHGTFACVFESEPPQRHHSMTEAGARKYVDLVFSKIAFVPVPNASHREKIRYILSQSDCNEYSLDDILNLDKRSAESARICANIVQNIPQRYRWECVKPEDIPCCYTIVADCKKLSNRDKPPRPMNAFMIWAQGARRLINELCPKMHNAAISEALGFYWRQKTDAFKQRFELEKIKLRRFHNVEFPQYKYKPKTKIQKAKEKKELSLSKCKMSKTAIKSEKLEVTESNVRRKSKYGRPRKAKQMFEPDHKVISNSTPATVSKCDESVKSSPTKPAIKDMLTLKILNDRRSKGMNIVNINEPIQSCLGQLSPLEVENPRTGDIFDELRDYESQMVSRDHAAMNVTNCFRSISSSVYDTPANTPPIDENDHPISPLQTSPTTAVSMSPSPVPQQPKVDRPTNCSTSSQLSPKETMPSLKAILSAGSPIARQSSQLRRDLPGLRVVASGRVSGHARKGKGQQRGISTDMMLSCVSDILNSSTCCDNAKNRTTHDGIDSNNDQGNVCDVNNNNCAWQYNNGDLNPGFAPIDAFHPKSPLFYPPAILDYSDLDTLSLDLNVPLLSDDVMKSLLNSL